MRSEESENRIRNSGKDVTRRPAGSQPLRKKFLRVTWPLVAAVTLALTATDVRAQFFAAENRIQVTEQMLEQWIFGSNRLPNQNPLSQAFTSLELQLDLVAQSGPLTEPQRAKLELAGLGDIHRFIDRYETFRRTCPTGQVTREEYTEMHQKMRPLQMRYKAGLHGPGSLFRKTVGSTLEPDQLAAFEKFEQQRHGRHYEMIVKATVAAIERQLPLTMRQREKLTAVILEKTQPPETYGQSYYQYSVVLYQASRIPEDDLKPIFLENEWPVFQGMMNHARGMEQQFRQFQDFDADE